MKIYINARTTVKDVQQQFAEAYPFLTIQFCDHHHRNGEETKNGYWFADGFPLAAVAKKPLHKPVEIRPWYKAGTVEQAFEKVFGLYAQIYRREGDRWIQTAGTDALSLEEQNAIGREWEEQQQGLHWIENKKRW